MTNKEKIIVSFNKVKQLGFVKSNRQNNTGIGKTFEDYVGVVENNSNEPDLYGYEIKSHREESQSYVTLFTKSPTFPRRANAILKNCFGTPYEQNPTLKKLHTSIFATQPNTYDNKYSFQLINDREEQRIYIAVYDIITKNLLDQSVYYSYSVIENALKSKLHNLFYVTASRKHTEEGELFHFNKAEIYSEPSFDKFLELLDRGRIMFDIRIGSYSSGKNYGKAHDHGSGFRIKEVDISCLYKSKEIVE